jgi:hypothetical protein
MALLGGWISSAGREERAVLRALAELSDRKMPVRLESEETGVSFFTVISLRRNGLLVARPRTLRGGLPKDSYVRLTLPNTERKQVRMPVLVPQLKLPMSMRYASICGVPQTFSGVCKRKAERFSTARFRNLQLLLPSVGRTFRVVDLSTSGIRIFTGTEGNLMMFEPESELAPARIRIGERAAIELDSLVPRARTGNAVGLSMQVRRDGASERFLMNLLNRLHNQELRRIQIDTA